MIVLELMPTKRLKWPRVKVKQTKGLNMHLTLSFRIRWNVWFIFIRMSYILHALWRVAFADRRNYQSNKDLFIAMYDNISLCQLESTKFRALTFIMNLLQSYNTAAKINTIQNASVRDLLGRLLSHYPDQRIGSDENPDIRSHPFFDSTDWHQIRVAILPSLRSKVTHFFCSK